MFEMSEHNLLTGRHYGLGDIRHASLRNTIGNRNLINATITLEAGDKKDIESQTVAMSYTIGGKMYAKAALADVNVVPADWAGDSKVQAADTKAYYALCIDTGGNITSYKGKDELTTTGDDAPLPGHPVDLCCFCVIEVVTVAVTFLQGVDDYDKAGVTSTFHNVACLPATAP